MPDVDLTAIFFWLSRHRWPMLHVHVALGDFLDGVPDYEGFARAAVAEGVRIFKTAGNSRT